MSCDNLTSVAIAEDVELLFPVVTVLLNRINCENGPRLRGLIQSRELLAPISQLLDQIHEHILRILVDLRRRGAERHAVVHVPDLGVARAAIGLRGRQAVHAAAAAVDHGLQHGADVVNPALVDDGARAVVVAEGQDAPVGVFVRPGVVLGGNGAGSGHKAYRRDCVRAEGQMARA